MASLLNTIRSRFYYPDGRPLSGGKVYTYEAGTLVPKATFSDAASTIPNANPVILDSAGGADIYISGRYTVRVADASGVLIEEIAQVADAVDVIALSDAITALNTDLTSRYQAADTLLQADIAAEIQIRESSDATLQAQIDAEAAARDAADVVLNQALAMVGGGAKAYQTKALMDAVTPTDPNLLAYVTNDATTNNNGLYGWTGSAWVKSIYDPLAQALAALAVEVANRTALIKSSTDNAITDANGFVLADVITQGLRWFVPIIAERFDIKDANGSIVADLTSIASTFAGFSVAKDGDTLLIKDGNGFVLASLNSDGFSLFANKINAGGVSVVNDGSGLSIKNDSGFVLAEFLNSALSVFLSQINIAGLQIIDRGTGLILQDSYGFYSDFFELIANTATPAATYADITKPMFSKTLAGWSNSPCFIDVPSLLDDRALQRNDANVLATIASQTTPTVATSDNTLSIARFSELGTSALLMLRDKRITTTRTRLPITCASVPDGSGSIAVHMIGDSIGNRGGGYLIDQNLTAHGYTATFIGTLLGASDASSSGSSDGRLGECREGWETGDFTYKVTNLASVVASGNESTYLSASKATKSNQNPYLRAATGGDSAGVIRNGYVFDFAYYLSRFSLATPQVVTIGLGTNDIRDLDNPTLNTDFYDNMKIMIDQIRVAVPSVPIIIYIPSTSYESGRNTLWASEYTTVIRNLQKLANDLNVIVAPTWAMTTDESGYTFTATSTDSVSGAETGAFTDSIHPYNTPRYQLYDVLSAYITAAKLAMI